MNTWRRPVSLFAVIAIAMMAAKGHAAEERLARVSFVELLANPAAWDGKGVRVQGFCHIEFEDTALYLHREDSETMNTLNAFWLEIPPNAYRKFSDHSVVVEGRFVARPDDHVGRWRGSIHDVKMYLVPKRSEL